MSTFYVLPPRRFLGQHLVGFLAAWLPGLDWDAISRHELAELAAGIAARSADVYVLHREDVPDGEDVTAALIDGFGAQQGDEVIEVRAGVGPGGLSARRWRVGVREAA